MPRPVSTQKLDKPGRRSNMNADTQMPNVLTLGTKARPLSYHNWVHLNPGDRVTLKRNGFAQEQGTVDDVGEDATYFWVWIDGQGRTLIFHGDGSILHKIPR
jgi:hypothetical protein